MIQAEAPRLILASASAARRSLLQGAGLHFEALSAAVDEAAIKEAAQAEAIPPADAALVLADAKAERIARRHPDALVIGCDQLLVCEGTWYDKPPNPAAARAQLQTLRGRTHELVTAVVCHRHGGRAWQHVAIPRLTMRDFTDEFLDAYLALEGDRVMGSVGAYRLEGPGVHLFARIRGDHAAILGLPLFELLGFLRQHGVVRS
ncbi:nucleoside triphosphate pyrophosphatase [Roseomonas sp. HF4]|uniref:Maf family protein n=1 Tax=Roseomonas sp. HF4 TaxID=2562313 RepID=UPI0010C10C7C|nr:nucleoside triphosphate pyrophosphatase [Roseomonas sp. HF4]